jgi:hypothetical protein
MDERQLLKEAQGFCDLNHLNSDAGSTATASKAQHNKLLRRSYKVKVKRSSNQNTFKH